MNYKDIKLILLSSIFILIGTFLLSRSIFSFIIRIYIVFGFIFLFVRFCLWGFSELFPKKYENNNNPYSVIVPVKDEPKGRLIKCLNSIINSQGEKEILVGDDGSELPIKEVLKGEKNILKHIKLIRSDKNTGKVGMQVKLIKMAKYDVCVNVDSDVIVKDNALKKLTAPFGNNKIGIANGRIKIISNGSLLHRLQDYQYLCAYEISRGGMGRFGISHCCSGEMLAFRKDVFVNFLDEYKNEKFLGKNLTHGQDRFMTNIFLREGYKSINMPESIGYTYPKENYKLLLKQYWRWKKSSIRESFRCYKDCKRNNKYLSLWSLLHIILPFLFLIILLTSLITDLLTLNISHFIGLLLVIISFSCINELPLLIKYPKLIPMLPIYTLFNITCVMPLWFKALFTLDNNIWGTR